MKATTDVRTTSKSNQIKSKKSRVASSGVASRREDVVYRSDRKMANIYILHLSYAVVPRRLETVHLTHHALVVPRVAGRRCRSVGHRNARERSRVVRVLSTHNSFSARHASHMKIERKTYVDFGHLGHGRRRRHELLLVRARRPGACFHRRRLLLLLVRGRKRCRRRSVACVAFLQQEEQQAEDEGKPSETTHDTADDRSHVALFASITWRSRGGYCDHRRSCRRGSGCGCG